MIDVASLHDPDYHLREVTHDPSAYYLRQGEAPGRWRGRGATALGLQGEVDPQALRDLFDGKHPATGVYLASARGSSARANARERERWVDVRAAAATLELSESRVRGLLREGRLAGEKTDRGAWRIPTDALAAYRAGGDQPRLRPELPAPGADGAYALVTAAEVAGVGRSYLQRLIATEPPEITTRDDGRAVQYLVGFRDPEGRWRVPAGELERFMAERTRPRAVPAYDLAVRAPKSVSVLHGLGHLVSPREVAKLGLPPGATVASEVLAAHHAAVDEVVEFLERHAAFVRGPGGRVPAQGLAVAVFDHRSSRTGDPLLHSHLVIANVATGVDGRVGALDSTALYAWARPAGHVYQARLRHELTSRLGVVFEQPHNGVADIDGVPRPVIDLFSQRRRQILERMARLGVHGAQAAQVATLDTRVAKDSCEHGRSPEELAAQAARVGFGRRQVASLLGRQRARRREVASLVAEVASARHEVASPVATLAERLAGPDGLCARDTTVDLRDAICGFATELPAGATAADLERWASDLLHDPARFVPVAGGATAVIRRADGTVVRTTGTTGPAFTTPELLGHEGCLVALHAAGLGQDGSGVGWGVATPDAVTTAVAGRPSLRAEQVAMVERITISGLGLDVVVGRPGSGKTFAVGAAADAWRAAGYRVVGASLQGGASEVLAVEADLEEQYTLTGLLLRCEQNHNFLAGSVVVVDEAGMADTRQLAHLATHAARAHAKLVLVGDPAQIPEVDAGGAFAHLVDAAGDHLVTLAENHRQTDPADRHRLELVRDGRGAEAIASAQDHARWHRGETADEVRELLLRDWHADPGVPAADKLLVATTVVEVEQLNVAARAMLTIDGRLGADALTVTLRAPNRAVDARELRVGDRVRATRNRHGHGVFTGRIGTVRAVDAKAFTVTVELDRMQRPDGTWRPRQVVTLDRTYLEEREMKRPDGHVEVQAPGLTHAYASTANAVQGRTAARAYVLVAEAGLYRQTAYVALSRARLETHLYGLTVPDLDEIDRHTQAGGEPQPDPDNTDALAAAIARDGAQTMASVQDPLAADAGALLRQPTAWLWAERQRIAAQLGGRTPLVEALRQVRTTLADTYHLPLEALECHQLTNAMTAALQVPGATPEWLARLMVTRGQAVTRELDSAEDPMAVLVWAAGDHAVEQLTGLAEQRAATDDRPIEGRVAEAVAEGRLRLLDAAIARQRDARLAHTEHDATGPVANLLGPLPTTPAAAVAWRRASAAIVEYRDQAGLFDRDGRDPDPWARAIGALPDDPRLARHHDQTRQIVNECRTTMVLAELPSFVPVQPGRPPDTIAALAGRPLAELVAERDADADGVAADVLPVDIERPRLLDEAIARRQTNLTAQVLTDPPPWLRAAVADEVADDQHPEPQRWAELAGRLACWADRTGRPLDALTITDLLGPRPTDAGLAAEWVDLVADVDPAVLNLSVEQALEPPMDLGL